MTLNRFTYKRLTGALLAFGLSLTAGTAYAALSPEQDALIRKGEYIAVAGDCVACHSTEGGKPFAGGLGLATPLGTIYSSNITPSKKTVSVIIRWNSLNMQCATVCAAMARICIRRCPTPRMPKSAMTI